MNFADHRFWEYLIVCLGVILLLRLGLRSWLRERERAERFDKVSLLALGLVLLAAVSWLTLAIYLTVCVVTYLGLRWILRHHARHAPRYLWVLIPLQLAPLFHYKYANFLLNGVLGLGIPWVRDLLIPVGISFYTFQLISFVVDTLVHKHPLPGFLDCLNFAGFFPQLVAGPIERRADLLPQMEGFRLRWLPREIEVGAGWVVAGLFFKCCLADNLAEFFRAGPSINAYQIWLDNVVFGLRIYYDFAGYSLVALGLGRCFGVRLTLNFESPYCSSNIGEFWRRWHITLSQWFRDYIYVPLGGGRARTWAFNIAVVFIVSGVWHGAGWNFILWGALHAGFLIVVRLSGRVSLPRPASWALTMLGAFLAWLCFYETDPERLRTKLTVLATPASYSLSALQGVVAELSPGERVLRAGMFLLVGATLVLEYLSVRRGNEPYALLRRRPVLVILVVLTVLLAPGKDNGFIYFAF